MGDSKEPPDPDILDQASTETLTEETISASKDTKQSNETSKTNHLNPIYQHESIINKVNDFINVREQKDLDANSSDGSIENYIFDNGFWKCSGATTSQSSPQLNSNNTYPHEQRSEKCSANVSTSTLKRTAQELEGSEQHYKQLYESVKHELQELKSKYETLIESDIPIVVQNKSIRKKCTKENCEKDDLQEKLKCKLCKRMVHYVCSRLPSYQIEHFIYKTIEL